MAIFGLIPARAGSKGIPHKNLAPCGGKPLIAHTFAAALGAARLVRTLLSTDDDEIAALGRAAGIDVPFRRPAELSTDDSPMLPVVRHALEWLEQRGERVDALVLLQPTSPLRTARHIDEAVDRFLASGATSVVSVVEVPHQFNPVSVLKVQDGWLVPFISERPPVYRRQDKPVAYARNGPAVLVASVETLRRGDLYGDRCLGYSMDARSSLDVDGPEDLVRANRLLSGTE